MEYYKQIIEAWEVGHKEWNDYKNRCLSFARALMEDIISEYDMPLKTLEFYDWGSENDEEKKYFSNLNELCLRFDEDSYCYLKFIFDLNTSHGKINFSTILKFKLDNESNNWFISIHDQKDDIEVEREKDRLIFKPFIKYLFDKHLAMFQNPTKKYLSKGYKPIGFK
jgi:hypothetical protein